MLNRTPCLLPVLALCTAATLQARDIEPGDRILIDFGGSSLTTSPDASGYYWNSFSTGGTSTGTLATSLSGSDGATLDVEIEITDAFTGGNIDGVVASDLYPSTAQRDTWYAGSPSGHSAGLADPAEIVISGLEANGYYSMRLFGSRAGADGSLDRLTRYTVNGATADLEATDNTDQTAYFAEVVADAQGEISVEVAVSPAGTGRFAYLGVLDLLALNPPAPDVRLLIDFGGTQQTSSPDSQGQYWNNFTTQYATPQTLGSGLADDGGNSTGIALELVDGFAGSNLDGVVSSAIYPSEAQRDSWWTGSHSNHSAGLLAPAELEFSGLQPDGEYTLRIFASRAGADGSLDRLTRYTVNGSTYGDLDATDNTSQVLEFSSVTASSSGELSLHVAVSPAGTGRYAYLGVVELMGAAAGELQVQLSNSCLEENLLTHSEVGDLSVEVNGMPDSSYSFTLVDGGTYPDNATFEIVGDALVAIPSFNYEIKSSYTVRVRAASSTAPTVESDLTICVVDRTDKWDTNGFADSDIAAYYPSVNVGDYVIFNMTDLTNRNVYQHTSSWSGFSYPNKIVIRGGEYNLVRFYLDNVHGNSASERIAITNFLGQVKALSIACQNGSFWRLTGKYDASAGLGDAGYPGCDKGGSSVDFGFSRGTYGFWAYNGWVNESGIMLSVSGTATNYEVDHIECSDGAFAGAMFKQDSGTVDMDGVYLHHLYIHDTGSEGIYLGSTGSDPQHQFNDLLIENCVILRAGGEALQTGQLGENVIIRNNVLWGAFDWLSPFQRYQDNVAQVTTRQGGVLFAGNILMGGGEKFFNNFNLPKSGITPNGQPIVFENNLMWGCRGPVGAYQGSNTDGVTDWEWNDNYWGYFDYDYDIAYPTADQNRVLLIATATVNVHMSNNLYEKSSATSFFVKTGSATTSGSGNSSGTVQAPAFYNLIDEADSYPYLLWKRWTATVGEDSSFPSSGTNKGDTVYYSPGDVVQYSSGGETRFYLCLQANSLHEPPLDGDSTWQLLTWDNSGAVSYCPPDDVRLDSGSFYELLDMGLQE